MPGGSRGNGRETEAKQPNFGGETAQDGTGATQVIVLVDVSNVAYGSAVKGAKPKVSYINRVLEHLASLPVKVVAIADATLRHTIDQPQDLEALFSAGSVQQVPAATSADDSLWELWKRYTRRGQRAFILTNDKFPNDRNAQESIVTWSPRIAHLFVGDELVLNPSVESLLDSGQSPDGTPREPGTDLERTMPGVSPAFGGVYSGKGSVALGGGEGRPASTPHQTETRAAGELDELVDKATMVIARYTEAPGGSTRSVNFATIAHDLHIMFGGDFVARFGLKRPKDLAILMAEQGLVAVTYKDATMYVEATSVLDSKAASKGLRRISRELSAEAAPSAPQTAAAVRITPEGSETSGWRAPEVVRVSAGAPAPIVEIGDPETFLKLARDHHAMHIFHWPVGVYSNEYQSHYRSGGEFFFVSNGTSFRLWGRAYRSLDDYVDARRHGFRGADHPSITGSRYEPYGPDIWRELEDLVDPHRDDFKPQEGDVYYCARESGFSDLSAFLADRKTKPKAGTVYF